MTPTPSTLTPEQSRAARGWLEWGQQELATAANVSLSTVRDFEKGRRVPISNNLGAMRAALEGRGIAFVEGETTLGVTGPKPGAGPDSP